MCVCVKERVCSLKTTKDEGKLHTEQRSIKDFGQVSKNQRHFFTPTHPLNLVQHKRQAATDFCDSLMTERITGLKLLTLYLSTMGSLTGPSLDLVKFGKLSRWAINGKPLVKGKNKYDFIFSLLFKTQLILLHLSITGTFVEC